MNIYDLDEVTLMKMAEGLAERNSDCSLDGCDDRKSTKKEAQILSNILFGSMLTLRKATTKEEARIVMDTAEYTAMQFLPKCNAYISVFCKLQEFYKTWGGNQNE